MIRQIITCRIGEQYLGIDIMAVREIRAWSSSALVPHVPDYVFGVVNLRGAVLPVIDLSARLGWDKTVPAERHVIIVVQMGEGLQGFIVDAVNDIVTLAQDSLQPAPCLGNDKAANFLEGLAQSEDRMIMVISLPHLDADGGAARLAA